MSRMLSLNFPTQNWTQHRNWRFLSGSDAISSTHSQTSSLQSIKTEVTRQKLCKALRSEKCA